MARHLGISIGLDQGIKALNLGCSTFIDTAKINDNVFLGVAGIGFDAQVAEQFALFGKRGLFSYCQVAVREFVRYKPEYYQMTVDGRKLNRKAFILSFANSSQYGNDFVIAPHASADDGYLDLILIDDIPAYTILQFLYQLKRGTIDHSTHFRSYRFKELTIHYPHMKVHIDGEPISIQNDIKVTIQPKSLKILVPRTRAAP